MTILGYALASSYDIRNELEQASGGAAWPYIKLQDFVANIVKMSIILASLGSFLLLIFGGIRYITSAGDKVGTQHAKETITAAMVGLIIVVGSYAAASTLGYILGFPLTSFKWPEAPRGSVVGVTCTSSSWCETKHGHKPTYGGCSTSWTCHPSVCGGWPILGDCCQEFCSTGCQWIPDPSNPTCCSSTGGCHP